jgi:5-methylcytosine-specific restriction endonuclease McrBC regulatory subunit McrC
LRRLELSIPGQIWEPVKEFVLTTIRQNAPHPLEGTGMRFFSILFSMQDLFERLVRRRVRQCLVGTALTLAPKERIPGTLEDQHGKQIGSLTPDLLLLNSAGDTAAVGDVKWKRLAENAAECTATITFRVWRQLSIYVSRISLF